MGLGRALYRGVKAAAKGGDAERVIGQAVGGLVPLAIKGGSEKVSGRVERGLRNVSDSGRSGTFSNHSTESDAWGDSPALPKPPAPGKSNLPKPPPPPPIDPWE